jgi:hypothetical protein
VTEAQFQKMYMQLGLVAYIEFKIKKFEHENFTKPTTIHLGELEWKTILESHPTRDLKIAGVPCVPHLGERQLVELE